MEWLWFVTLMFGLIVFCYFDEWYACGLSLWHALWLWLVILACGMIVVCHFDTWSDCGLSLWLFSDCGLLSFEFEMIVVSGEAIPMDVLHTRTYRLFCNKIWQSFRFALQHLQDNFTPLQTYTVCASVFHCTFIIDKGRGMGGRVSMSALPASACCQCCSASLSLGWAGQMHMSPRWLHAPLKHHTFTLHSPLSPPPSSFRVWPILPFSLLYLFGICQTNTSPTPHSPYPPAHPPPPQHPPHPTTPSCLHTIWCYPSSTISLNLVNHSHSHCGFFCCSLSRVFSRYSCFLPSVIS